MLFLKLSLFVYARNYLPNLINLINRGIKISIRIKIKIKIKRTYNSVVSLFLSI